MKTPRDTTELLFAGQGYCASHLDGGGAGPAGIGCAACVRWAMEDLVQHAIAAEKARADEAEKKVNVLGAACQKMAYNWLAHSGFSRIDQYVQHAVNCGGGKIACSCGATQSITTFKAGRQAIDAALPLIGDLRR